MNSTICSCTFAKVKLCIKCYKFCLLAGSYSRTVFLNRPVLGPGINYTGPREVLLENLSL